LAHSIQKNHNVIEKKFNVKIFDREPNPQDRWQGYHITLNCTGVRSLIKCIPESIATRLHEVIPDSISDGIENHVMTIHDHIGNVLLKSPEYQFQNVYEFSKLNNKFAFIVSYRDRLRDLLLEGIDVQWGKKCVGYHENEEGVWAIFEDGTRVRGDFLVGADGIHSTIRKQKIPELKINNLGITQCLVDVAPNKELFDRMLSITGNGLIQSSMGPKGDCIFLFFRLIPIYSSNAIDESTRYRVTFSYSYPSEQHEKDDNWTYKDDELPTSKFPDDENPKVVFNDIKKRIKENRPQGGELTDVFLEIWELVKLRFENDYEKYPFKTLYPLRRRPLRDIDPETVDQWKTTRVTFLGDAVHAMNPWVGI
ncbi:1207_t:CDS:2, partial [Funneliformis geosporum]